MNIPRFERAFCIAMFAICALVHLKFSSVGWQHNLRELHEFRQVQTALSARYLQAEGFSLSYPLPLFGPPWSAPLEFPLYQVCVAKLGSLTHLPLEQAGRLVSLVFFWVSLPPFFLSLGWLGISTSRRWLFLGLLLVAPVYLFYSRSVLIESTGMCLGAWFLYAYGRSLETLRWTWILTALVFGSLASLTKITTFVVFLIPAIALTLSQLWFNRPQRTGSWTAVLRLGGTGLAIAMVALYVGQRWIAFGDRIKAANPLSDFLVSTTMGDWNFGTLAQRIDPKIISSLSSHTTNSVLNWIPLVLLVPAFAMAAPRQRVLMGVLVVCYLSGALLFTNLYVQHDYYFYATAVFLLGAVMVGWDALLESTRLVAPIKYGVIAITIAAQIYGYRSSYYHVQTRADVPYPELAQVLAKATRPDDIILLYGFMWNPLIPYASGRKSIMVIDYLETDDAALDDALKALPPGSVGAIAVAGHLRRDPAFLYRLTTKLGFSEQPQLQDTDTVVFLAPRLLATALPRLAATPLSTLEVADAPTVDFGGVKLRRYFGKELSDKKILSLFSPAPTEILAPFGVTSQTTGGRDVLSAHAPTEIAFELGPTNKRLTADFGILPAAYAESQKTDGVTFVIEWRPSHGTPTKIFERSLNPAATSSDRGIQHVDVAFSANEPGRLVLQTLPGPANNITFDWAYWTAIEIR